MAKQVIGIGTIVNDGTGDSLRVGADKTNDNFLEIYTYLGAGSTTTLSVPLWSSTDAGINTLRSVGVGTTNPQSTLQVGTGITMDGDLGQIRTVGVVTASAYYGDGSNLTGIAAGGGGSFNELDAALFN